MQRVHNFSLNFLILYAIILVIIFSRSSVFCRYLFNEVPMKKIIQRIALVSICLIPALIAVLVYLNAQKLPAETANITSLLWKDPGGKETRFLMKDKEGELFITFLLKLNQNAVEVDKLPEDCNTDTYYTATLHSDGKSSVYRYYFSTKSPSHSYLVDPQKQVYRINALDAIEFLDSERSIELYPSSVLPVISVAGQRLEPSNVDWTYFTYSGISHQRIKENSETPILSASYVGITIDPSLVPDSSLLEITDDKDNLLFRGSLDKYDSATTLKKQIRKDTLLHFTLRTEWNKKDSIHYQGKAEFRFDVQTVFDPAANFWLGESSVELGELVVLSGEFVEEINELSFKSSPSIGFTPTFVQDGDLVRALIPISRDLVSGAGTYTLTAVYQGKEYPLTLQVKVPSNAETKRKYNYSQKVNTHLRTEENLDHFRNFIDSLPVSSTLLCDGKFKMNPDLTIRAKFGDMIHNTNNDDEDFRSNGLALVAYSSTPILAVNRGKVIAVITTEYGGKTVVIDHGWGLYSVYYCLGSTLVEEGTYVTQDSIVGYGGKEGKGEGYTDGITSYCELWVGGQPVSYYPLQNEGVVVGTRN